MVMNLYILFLISLPEAFLNLMIILLFAGAKDKLKVNRPNVIRFSVTLILMLAASWLIRPIAPDIFVNMSLHVIAYVIIISIIYKINFIYILIATSFASLISATIENTYMPYIIIYGFKGMENFQKAYHLYVVLSLPYRITQLLVARFLWKHELLLVTKINRRFHSFFIVSALILSTVEFFFIAVYFTYSDKLSIFYQIGYSIALFLMVVVFNLFIFKFVYNTIGGIVVKGYVQYTEFEENVKFALSEIRDLLKDNRVDEAIELIDELNGNNN